jgi:hypothetical protein
MEHMETEWKHGLHKHMPGMVVGSRAHLAKDSIAKREWYRTILMKGFHFFVMLLCTSKIHDTQCGFKLFTKDVGKLLFENLHMRGWSFDIEIIYMANVLGIPMVEVIVRFCLFFLSFCILIICMCIGTCELERGAWFETHSKSNGYNQNIVNDGKRYFINSIRLFFTILETSSEIRTTNTRRIVKKK